MFMCPKLRLLPLILLLMVLAAVPAVAQEILVNRMYSTVPGDGNRDPNWDWTQNVMYTLYTDAGPVTVQLPYYSAGGPAAGDLNVSTGRDIYPADGWVLVVRHFGNPSFSVNLPYFILYNKYRGLLRIFYWSSLNTPVTRAVAVMSFQDTTLDKTAALMTFSGPDPEYVNSYNPKKAQIAIGKMEFHQWGYFDFDVSGYDPNLASRVDPTLKFQIVGVQESEIVLQGTIQTDTGTTTAQKEDSANDIKNIVNSAVTAYEKPAKRYKQIEDARQAYEQMADQKSDEWWAKYLKSIGGLASKEWLKALGPVAGFVEAALGFGSGSGGATPLLINATVKLNGNMTTQTAFYSIILRAPGAIHADPTNDASSNALPLYDRPLGIFNLLAVPVLTVTHQDQAYPCYVPFSEQYPGGPPETQVETCRKSTEQRLARLDYVVNPDSGLVVNAIDAAYLPSVGLPDFYVEGSSDGYRPLCDLQQTVVRNQFYGCPPPYMGYCPENYFPPEVDIRNIGLRVQLRAPAAAIEPTLIIRKYKPTVGSASPSPSCSTSSSANPFKYARARDQYLACWGIAGRISSNCRDISDQNDRQMCYGMSTSTQSPCTSMTDRNLQLSCYGMSVAPNYPSNCRDITNSELRDFCYSVSSWGSWANCSGVSDSAEKALCQALTYRNSSYCASITNSNDRWFCYGTSSRTNSYCGNIVY